MMIGSIISNTALWPMTAVAWAATFLLHSTLLICCIWLLTRLLGMRAMTVQDKLWKVALTGALFSCTVQAGLGDGAVAPRILLPPVSAPAMVTANDSAPTAMDLSHGRSVSVPARLTEYSSTPTALIQHEPVVRESERQVMPLHWQWFILLFWGLGAAGYIGVLARHLIQLNRLFRERREITSGPLYRIFKDLVASRYRGCGGVRLTVSQRIPVPVAYGIRRPEICLPRSMAREAAPGQLKSVLAHELAHIFRRDQAWLLAARLLEGIFFFQPLIRLARRYYQETAEFICDGEAVRQTGERVPLARSLHEMALRQVSTPTALTIPGISGKGSPLNRRIEMILDKNRPATGRARWFGPLAVALILVFALLAPGVTAGDNPPPRPDEVKPVEAAPAPAAPGPDRVVVTEAVEAPAADMPRPAHKGDEAVAALMAPRTVVQAAVDLAISDVAVAPRTPEPVEPPPRPRITMTPAPGAAPIAPEPVVWDEDEIDDEDDAAAAEAMQEMEREMALEEEAMELDEQEMALEEEAMQEMEREMALEEEAMQEMEREMALEEEAMAEAEREMELMAQELAAHELDLARAERELAEQEDDLARDEEALHAEEEEAESTDGEPRQLSKARQEEIRRSYKEMQERHHEITRQHAEISRHHRDVARQQVEALRQRRAVFHSEETALRAQRRGLERALRALDTSLADELTDEQRDRLGAMRSDIEDTLRELDGSGGGREAVLVSETVSRPQELN